MRSSRVVLAATVALAVVPLVPPAHADAPRTARAGYLGAWVEGPGTAVSELSAGQPLGTVSFVALAGEYTVTVAARDVTGLPVGLELWQRTLHGDARLGAFCAKTGNVRLQPARTEVIVRVLPSAACPGASGVPLSGEVVATFRR